MAPRSIVITGASSGMGRAAALKLAARKDNLVVAARREGPLRELAAECGRLGGRAIPVPADVSDEEAVERVAATAVAEFGHLDAWVNTAAVQAFGRFWDVPTPVLRRIVDVDLVGSMLVAKTALRQFEHQGGGTLVLVSSVLGKAPIPYLNVYAAAKHGVVGFATSLRADLKEAGVKDVHVVNLMPPSTDTPFYEHAANYVGKAPRPPPPVYSVDTLADAIVEAIDRPQDEDVTVGAMGKLMRLAHAAAPGLYETLTGPYSQAMFSDEPRPVSDGSVLRPIPQGTSAAGGWKEQGARR